MSGERRPIRAIVVDDETLAREYLLDLLEAHPEVEVVAECANGFEAVKAVTEHEPDLLFLDIQMPKLNGFEVLELLEQDVDVVFITAYDQYALKAFDAHALDYLLKPFSPERLAAAIDNVYRRRGERMPKIDSLRQESSPDDTYLKRVVVRDGARVVIIRVEEIDFVQAEDDYVAIHAVGQSHLKHQTLASLCDALDPARFVRIHRSTLVNIERIDRIELEAKDRYIAILKDGTLLNISRSGHKRLKERLA